MPLKQRDEELKNVIRNLGHSQSTHNATSRIDSCSHTLETLVKQLQSSLENEESLKNKIAEQKSSFYHLKLQLTDQKSKNQKLEQDIDILQADMEELSDKNKKLENSCQQLQNVVDETRAMSLEEGYSFNNEFYQTKIKNDRLKNLMIEYKKDLQRLMGIEVKHDLLQEKLDDILADKIETKKVEKLAEERLRASLVGHVDYASTLFIQAQVQAIAQNQLRDCQRTQPIVITLSFMEPREVLKFMQVSKKVRSSFLSNMAACSIYHSLFHRKFKDQSTLIDQKQEIVRGHERNIRFLKEQDNLRTALMNETPEEYIKQIIEKFIVKPKFEAQ